jgi:hypothetical protein
MSWIPCHQLTVLIAAATVFVTATAGMRTIAAVVAADVVVEVEGGQ